jgi:hypothetical protein
MHLAPTFQPTLLLLTVTGMALILYVMRRRVRLGRRTPKF